MKRGRGRPVSNFPHIHRIETRITENIFTELNSICKRTNLTKTRAIDWAIHLTYLILSDSRTHNEVMNAFRFTPYKNSKKQVRYANSVIDSLSDINERFPDINEQYLEFILEHENIKSSKFDTSKEELVAMLIETQYLHVRDLYTKEEVLAFGITEDNY